MKTRGMVRKRRTTIQPHDLERLHEKPQNGWEGFWYHRRVNLRGLQPICAITYLRFAFLALQSPEPLRLTIDEDLIADRANQFHLTRELTGTSLLPEKSILELKYVGDTPMLFKALVDTFHLTPEPVSKYRLAVPSLGLAPKLPTQEVPAVTPHSSLVCS